MPAGCNRLIDQLTAPRAIAVATSITIIAPCGSIASEKSSAQVPTTASTTAWRSRFCGASADTTPPNARATDPRTWRNAKTGTIAHPTRKVRDSSGARRSPSATTTAGRGDADHQPRQADPPHGIAKDAAQQGPLLAGAVRRGEPQHAGLEAERRQQGEDGDPSHDIGVDAVAVRTENARQHDLAQEGAARGKGIDDECARRATGQAGLSAAQGWRASVTDHASRRPCAATACIRSAARATPSCPADPADRRDSPRPAPETPHRADGRACERRRAALEGD